MAMSASNISDPSGKTPSPKAPSDARNDPAAGKATEVGPKPDPIRVNRIKVNRILVPTDFSELSMEALEYASRIAGIVKADLLLLHAAEADALKSGGRERLQQELNDQVAALRSLQGLDPTMQVHTLLQSGKVPAQIAATASREDVDLVVMGTRGQRGNNPITRYFLDSNAKRTVEECRVPVLTLRQKPNPFHLRNILLPLDLTERTDRKVDLAINLAKLFDARLRLVAVAHFMETLQRKDVRLLDAMDFQRERIRSTGVDVSTEIIRHDNVGDSVVQYAEEIEADLILILTARENRLDHLLMGSRAGRVIDHALRPVLSLHPPDLERLLGH
jgi:nucleotide-binding universal stress UspA family protein